MSKQWSPTSNTSSAAAPLTVKVLALLKQLSPMWMETSEDAEERDSVVTLFMEFDTMLKDESAEESTR